ncbi:MAG: hypothetical protein ABIR98_15175 [Usitatibacter sp.]
MRVLCAKCRTGPSGVEGHSHLLAQILGDSWMAFTCQGCNAMWSRTARPNRYTWARLPKRHGMPGVHIPRPRDSPLY